MDKEKAILTEICVNSMKDKGLISDEHKARLTLEIKHIDNLGEYDYFLDLHRRNVRFSQNENNLFVAHLLDLCVDFDIEKEAAWIQGELPDIDVDYLPQVREYLKTVWAAKEFGADNICAIGNYTTFGIKSALIDMAKVHGKDRNEVLSLTTKLGLKDEDGKVLTFDKALESMPELAEYCKNNPDVGDSAKRLLNRNRGMSMHAGGLIIANQRIDNFVPLVRGKDNAHVSAFVEGLHGTDLGPLGLVKFDLLVITNLLQIAIACKLIKDRHGVASINALPGLDDWSDISYLNDPKSLVLANDGQLKCIFQFDSDGIRQLAKEGTVTGFDDLVAYSALYRPGPLNCEMDKAYIRRKRGVEKYELHSLLSPILEKTYGVLVFQEQVMQILNAVGGVPLSHCEKVRKAISKKQIKGFSKYKDMFLENGQKRLGWTEEQVNNLWQQIESFAEYGFNKSHAVAYAYISARLLWLKAHYPLEFFAAILSCSSDEQKIKDYKQEADKHGVKLNRIDINKSGWNFKIVDNEIFMGFSNVKGIGEEMAQRIVAGQPYQSLEDFIHRFGTDATALKPIIGLCVFCPDNQRRVYYEFYEHYKKEMKKREDRSKRNDKSRLGIIEEMTFLLGDEAKDLAQDVLDKLTSEINTYANVHGINLNDFNAKKWKLIFEDVVKMSEFKIQDMEQSLKVFRKYRKNVDGYAQKIKEDGEITLADFKPTGNIPEDLGQIYDDIPQVAESLYYGFGWDHLLEYSKDYMGGMTFDQFDDDTKLVCCVEIHIVKPPETRVSKKGNEYYSIKIEDANWRQVNMTVWGEDFGKFKEEFEFWDGTRKGNLLRVRVERPGAGFSSYTFDSPPKHRKSEIPKDKNLDYRLEVMARPDIVPENVDKPVVSNITEIDSGLTILG